MKKLYESLCEQDCKNFEWLIIDDGSKDDTEKFVEQMKMEADFLVVYYKKEHGGKHTSLNFAYQFIRTPLTFIVDSDDTLTADAVSTIEKTYVKYKDETDLCGFSFLRGKRLGYANIGYRS